MPHSVYCQCKQLSDNGGLCVAFDQPTLQRYCPPYSERLATMPSKTSTTSTLTLDILVVVAITTRPAIA